MIFLEILLAYSDYTSQYAKNKSPTLNPLSIQWMFSYLPPVIVHQLQNFYVLVSTE